MLAELEEIIPENEEREMPSVNHSYICNRVLRQLFENEAITKYAEMPILAIEVISASQNIQDLLIKAETLVKKGVRTVWTIEPFTNSIFVTNENGEEKFDSQIIESEHIKVDFRRIFEE
jgi:Uma2 family endonuclease